MNAEKLEKTLKSLNLRKLAKSLSLIKWLTCKKSVSIDIAHFAVAKLRQIMFIKTQYINFSSGGN